MMSSCRSVGLRSGTCAINRPPSSPASTCTLSGSFSFVISWNSSRMRSSRFGDKGAEDLEIIQLSDDMAARPQGRDDQRDYEDTRRMAREYRFANGPSNSEGQFKFLNLLASKPQTWRESQVVNSGCGLKSEASSIWNRTTSLGSYSYSSPHSSHFTVIRKSRVGGGANSSVSPNGILWPLYMF
jgi:hypothetical protein